MTEGIIFFESQDVTTITFGIQLPGLKSSYKSMYSCDPSSRKCVLVASDGVTLMRASQVKQFTHFEGVNWWERLLFRPLISKIESPDGLERFVIVYVGTRMFLKVHSSNKFECIKQFGALGYYNHRSTNFNLIVRPWLKKTGKFKFSKKIAADDAVMLASIIAGYHEIP